MLYIIIAYILLYSLVPLISGILSMAWLPVAIGMNKVGIHRYWSGLSIGVFTAALSLGLGWLAFFWLGVTFGWIAGLCLVVMAFMLGQYRIKTREDTSLELGTMIGDIGGLWVGTWCLNSWDGPTLPIIMAVVTAVLAIGIYRKFVDNGNLAFWAAVQQHPQAAKTYFFNSHDWTFLNEANYHGMKTTYERLGYIGPFQHRFDTGKVYLYYKGDDIDASQHQFISTLDATARAIHTHQKNL